MADKQGMFQFADDSAVLPNASDISGPTVASPPQESERDGYLDALVLLMERRAMGEDVDAGLRNLVKMIDESNSNPSPQVTQKMAYAGEFASVLHPRARDGKFAIKPGGDNDSDSSQGSEDESGDQRKHQPQDQPKAPSKRGGGGGGAQEAKGLDLHPSGDDDGSGKHQKPHPFTEGILQATPEHGGEPVVASIGPQGWQSKDLMVRRYFSAYYPPVPVKGEVPWIRVFWKAVHDTGAKVIQEPSIKAAPAQPPSPGPPPSQP